MNALAPPLTRHLMLDLDEIDVREGHRPVDMEAVRRLAKSIEDIGLQYPITAVAKGQRFALVAGLHRLEASRVLGEERIPATIVKLSDIDARLWEISENLHRAELTVTQRAEYVDLAKQKRESEKAAQLAQADPRYEKRATAPRRGILAFLATKCAARRQYSRIFRQPPAEADMQRHFQVSPPSVHQTVLTLERAGLIRRTPGVARSIEILVEPEDLPVLR
jgi:ParB-like chromosome segregation protein Spo0J